MSQDPVCDLRGKGSKAIPAVDLSKQTGSKGNAFCLIGLILPFRLQRRHIHAGGAFPGTSLAAQAQVHHFGQSGLIEGIAFWAMRQVFPERICPGAGAVLFFPCGLVAGTHGASC